MLLSYSSQGKAKQTQKGGKKCTAANNKTVHIFVYSAMQFYGKKTHDNAFTYIYIFAFLTFANEK